MVFSKLKVVEYFDSVASEIDYFTEKEILAHGGNERVEELLNERRQVLLSKVNEIQLHCLSQFKQSTTADEISNKSEESYTLKAKVFSKFCFTHVYSGLVYLFAVDYYVSSREIERFKACLWPPKKTGQTDVNIETDEYGRPIESDELIQLKLEIIDPSLLTSEEMYREKRRQTSVHVDCLKMCDIFKLDSPVIHVSKPFELERITLEGPIEVDDFMTSCQATENKLICARTLEVDIHDSLRRHFSDCYDSFMSLFSLDLRMERLIIRSGWIDDDIFDEVVGILSDGKELFKSVRLDTDHINESFWTMQSQVDSVQEASFSIWSLRDCSIDSVFKQLSFWNQLESLELECVDGWFDTEDELSREQFSCLSKTLKNLSVSLPVMLAEDALCDLHNLRSLHLNIDRITNYDWSFLDSVSDTLETLSVYSSRSVSSDALRDMPSLKELDIYGRGPVGIEIKSDSEEDENAELFTGLESLEKLRIGCVMNEKVVNNPRYFARLSSLQHLNLNCGLVSYLTLFSLTTRDSCPQLFSRLLSLELDFNSLNSLCPKPFSRLAQLRSIALLFNGSEVENSERVTQELFHGLGSLTHLKLSGNRKYTIDPDAFSDLDKLVDIQIFRSKQTFEELKETGLFDQCKLINNIIVGNSGVEPVAVFFDKLGRFVLVNCDKLQTA